VKFKTPFWIIITAVTIATFAHTLYRSYSLGKELQQKQQQLTQQRPSSLILEAYEQGLTFVGASLKPVPLKSIDDSRPLEFQNQQPGLILYLDEVGCTTCADAETAFARDVAFELGLDRVQIIVRANKHAYARSYVRVNSVDPSMVFFDSETTFAKANNVRHTPTLFVHDGLGTVVSAHIPTTAITDMTEIFHRSARQFLLETNR
jgi:hypothetical protein